MASYSAFNTFQFVARILILVLISSCQLETKTLKLESQNESNEQLPIIPKDRGRENTPRGSTGSTIVSRDIWLITDFDNVLWGTSNHGEDWNKLLESKSFLSPPSFINSKVGFIVKDHQILKTRNGGAEWRLVTVAPANFNRLFFLDEEIGWAIEDSYSENLGFFAKIWNTVDGGLNWMEQTIDRLTNLSQISHKKWGIKDIYFLNKTEGWAIGTGIVLVTNDGGQTWVVRPNLVGDFTRIKFFDDRVGWIQEKNLQESIITENGGKTWRPSHLPDTQNGSAFIVLAGGRKILMDSRGYVLTSRRKATFKSTPIMNQQWNSRLNTDAVGMSILDVLQDGTVIALWLLEDEVLAINSDDNGKSWH